ncbi:SH3 domain-containing protein [Candidatus Chloroploca sp. M-50]|uniref:SH3 domain-containing protein n=1 Tax=Candidatus Chloroploca mongolica TaxID=2528176 RepID=A0ABS4DBA0_9CHLR|nr:SH3 domain-containing protein [Candidatus Chloroploca mongolica]MBP1466729.1 SH3 domain-containing protein [Candidatus Chloroploca mongolica]
MTTHLRRMIRMLPALLRAVGFLLLLGLLTIQPAHLAAQIAQAETPILGAPTIATPVMTAPATPSAPMPMPSSEETGARRAPTSTPGTAALEQPHTCEPHQTRSSICAQHIDPELHPDPLENNWHPESAAPIAVGVIYDLNFVCPVPNGCPGGDHDYLRVTVKGGTPYLITTFDLGPGVDTVLDLFWGDPEFPVMSNDDAFPGRHFLSTIRWEAPDDGELLIRVAPRTGGDTPHVAEPEAGTYRFVIALDGSALAHQLDDRIRQEAGVPTPTPPRIPTSIPSAVGAPSVGSAQTGGNQPVAAPTAVPAPVLTQDAPQGRAMVRTSTALRDGPGATQTLLTMLPEGTRLTLLGQTQGRWVRVQPDDLVLPGWVAGMDLSKLPDETPLRASGMLTTTEPVRSPPDPTTTTIAGEGTPPRDPAPTSLPGLSTTGATVSLVERLEPLPPPPPPAPVQRISRSLTLQVERSPDSDRTPSPGHSAFAGLRVQLVTVFGDILAEAVTPASGQVTLTTEVLPAMAVLVQIPAAGLRFPLDPTTTSLRLVLPTEVQP